MNSLGTNRLVAAAIRDVLQQHGDIFAEIGPSEVRAQLLARLAAGGAVVESYLRGFDQALESQQTIIPRRASLVRDVANLRTLRGHSDRVTHVVALDRERALSASYDNTLRLWDLDNGLEIARFTGEAPLTTVALTNNKRGMVVAGDRQGRVLFLILSKSCLQS